MKGILFLIMLAILGVGIVGIFQQGWVSSVIMTILISFVIGYMLSQRERKEEY